MEDCVTDLICQSFEVTDGTHVLRDAICLTQAQWDAITPEELAAMKQARLEKWLGAVNPTKEQLAVLEAAAAVEAAAKPMANCPTCGSLVAEDSIKDQKAVVEPVEEVAVK